MADFEIVGATIVDPEGNVFTPVGANIGAPLVDSDGGDVWLFRYEGHDITSDESVEAVQAWGWNTLRLNAMCLPVEANEFNAAWGPDEMLAAIDQVVDTYTPLGIVVMIECHDLTGTSPEIGSADYEGVEAFWDLAAERYGDNTYVWFNHLNEFQATSTDAAEAAERAADAASADDARAYWRDVIDDGYEGFVERGVSNIVVFDLPNYGNDLGLLADADVQEWASTKCNTIYAWHAYGGNRPGDGEAAAAYDFANPDTGAYESQVADDLGSISDAGIPLIVGEFGHDWDDNRRQTNFQYESELLGARTALELAPEHGYGLLVWHANGNSGVETTYGVKNSDTDVFSEPTPDGNLNATGEIFWDLSQQVSNADPEPGPGDGACER